MFTKKEIYTKNYKCEKCKEYSYITRHNRYSTLYSYKFVEIDNNEWIKCKDIDKINKTKEQQSQIFKHPKRYINGDNYMQINILTYLHFFKELEPTNG